MTDEFQKMMERQETRVQRVLYWSACLCFISVLPCLLSFAPSLVPKSQPMNMWFQRSGAVMSIFALLAQSGASHMQELIRPGTFGETAVLYRKYDGAQRAVSGASIILAIAGTVIWGYGDLLLPYLSLR